MLTRLLAVQADAAEQQRKPESDALYTLLSDLTKEAMNAVGPGRPIQDGGGLRPTAQARTCRDVAKAARTAEVVSL